jgi:hypothetical protein
MATDTPKTSKDSVLAYMKVSIDVLEKQPSVRAGFVLYKFKTHIENLASTPNRTFKDSLDLAPISRNTEGPSQVLVSK